MEMRSHIVPGHKPVPPECVPMKTFVCFLTTTLILHFLLLVWTPLSAAEQENGFHQKTWKTVAELSEAEKSQIDFRVDTPRDATIPYLPAEAYPFQPPFTAEEMGYRSMEFPHVARWSHAMADVFGAITSHGFLDEGITIGFSHYVPDEDGVLGQLSIAPGDAYFRMAFFYTYPPENLGLQDLWILRRTDKEATTKLDNFIYSPSLRRVRRQPQPRRDVQFPNNVQTFDDVVGRDAWEFTWRVLGTDVLYETIRFPNTRPTVTLANPDGSFTEKPSDQIKMLGDAYPSYTNDGGVNCYVVEATRREDWLPNYRMDRIIYWLDQQSFYPLRIEQYDNDNQLRVVEVRNAYLVNSALAERGYAGLFTVYYDVALDLMSYSVHDAHWVKAWSQEDQSTMFEPDFMRRSWLKYPLKSQALVYSPEKFFLRPELSRDKFPQHRNIVISEELEQRYRLQEEAGRLVFETPSPLIEASAPQ